MIIGIGTDITEVYRIEKACGTQAFLMRYFTDKEREILKMKYQSIASNFAVKESVAKAFGTGFRGFEPKDIEVLRDELGKPYINLYGKAKELAQQLGIEHLHVSITNTKELASAFVVGECA